MCFFKIEFCVFIILFSQWCGLWNKNQFDCLSRRSDTRRTRTSNAPFSARTIGYTTPGPCVVTITNKVRSDSEPISQETKNKAPEHNKKAQLTLSNPRDVKACKNCSNSTCFISCHRIPFPQIANA